MNVDKISTKGGAPLPTKKKVSKYTRENVKSGRLEQPLRVFLYGEEGIGKSTFAFGAPEPAWLGADKGTHHLDIKHRLAVPESWDEILEALRFMQRDPGGAKTLVIDPIGWFQPLVHARVVADKGWRDIETDENGKSGFGKGITAAEDYWRVFVHELEILGDLGMNVIVIAHADVKKERNPEVEEFDRYVPQLAKGAAMLLRQWADYVLFARQKVWTKVGTDKKFRGATDGARVIHTQGMPAYIAKSRPQLPPTLPLSWTAFAEARGGSKRRLAELATQLDALLEQLGDPEAEQNARAYVAKDPADLGALEEVVNAISLALEERADKAIGTNEETATEEATT